MDRVFAPEASSGKPSTSRSNSGSSTTSASSLELPPTPVTTEVDEELAWLARKRGNVKHDPTAMPNSAQFKLQR